MSKMRVLALALAVAACSGCGHNPAGSPLPGLPTQAQPKLQTVKVAFLPGMNSRVTINEPMVAELAATPEQVRTGMMFRTNMAESEGMLFDLGYPQRTGFWMPNCPLPLSVAYINPQGMIEEIHDLQPFNTNTVPSHASNIEFALETRQGWFQRHNIKPGIVLRTEKGSLRETFSRGH
jgi:uncharacterized protein